MWSAPSELLMSDLLLKLCKYKDSNVDMLCQLLSVCKDSITSSVMKALINVFIESQKDEICLTLFNMCINGLFPKFSNKDIDIPSELMRKLLVIQSKKMYID